MKTSEIIAVILLFVGFTARAQDSTNTHTKDGKKIIQFHGLVMEGDSLYGVGGARVYDPKSNRGATTGVLGYFSFPVVEGDSILVRAVGYKGVSLKIPMVADSTFTYFKKIVLNENTYTMDTVTLGGLPPEEIFKEAVLAYSDPADRDLRNADNNLNDRIMAHLLENSDMSANMNHAYYMGQQVQYIENRYMATSSPFLDPFAWNRFFKDLEREKQKNKEEDKRKNNVKPY